MDDMAFSGYVNSLQTQRRQDGGWCNEAANEVLTCADFSGYLWLMGFDAVTARL